MSRSLSLSVEPIRHQHHRLRAIVFNPPVPRIIPHERSIRLAKNKICTLKAYKNFSSLQPSLNTRNVQNDPDLALAHVPAPVILAIDPNLIDEHRQQKFNTIARRMLVRRTHEVLRQLDFLLGLCSLVEDVDRRKESPTSPEVKEKEPRVAALYRTPPNKSLESQKKISGPKAKPDKSFVSTHREYHSTDLGKTSSLSSERVAKKQTRFQEDEVRLH